MNIKEGVHKIKVGSPRNEIGREIYNFQCLLCLKVFIRHRYAPAHAKYCQARKSQLDDQLTIQDYFNLNDKNNEKIEDDEKTFIQPLVNPLDKQTIALVELIFENNIPYTQLALHQCHETV